MFTKALLALLFFLLIYIFLLGHSTTSNKSPSKDIEDLDITLVISDYTLWDLRILHENMITKLCVVKEEAICHKWIVIDIGT